MFGAVFILLTFQRCMLGILCIVLHVLLRPVSGNDGLWKRRSLEIDGLFPSCGVNFGRGKLKLVFSGREN